MKSVLTKLFFAGLFCPAVACLAQEAEKEKKNFITVAAVFDVSNLSNAFCLEYERDCYSINHIVFGLRGNYYLPYRSENFFLTKLGHGYSIYSNDYTLSLLQAWGIVSLYTARRAANNGFFLSSAIGITHNSARKVDPSPISEKKYNNILGGIELGMGIKWPLSKKLDGRFAGTISLHSSQEGPGLHRDALFLMGFKFSTGF